MTIVAILLLVLFTFAAAWLSEAARCHTVEVSCRCGAKRAVLSIVDTVDAARYADLLSDGCPRCCRSFSRRRPSTYAPGVIDAG